MHTFAEYFDATLKIVVILSNIGVFVVIRQAIRLGKQWNSMKMKVERLDVEYYINHKIPFVPIGEDLKI